MDSVQYNFDIRDRDLLSDCSPLLSVSNYLLNQKRSWFLLHWFQSGGMSQCRMTLTEVSSELKVGTHSVTSGEVGQVSHLFTHQSVKVHC